MGAYKGNNDEYVAIMDAIHMGLVHPGPCRRRRRRTQFT